MRARVNVSLGTAKYQFDIDEKDEMETLHRIIVLGNPPTKCNLCGNDNPEEFKFTSNKDKEANTYVNVKCKCDARSKLGQYKAGGYFWKEFEKYQGKSESTENKVALNKNKDDEEDDDDGEA